MRHSIRLRYTGFMVAVLLAVLAALLVFVNFGMEGYVTRNKEARVKEAIPIIKEYAAHQWSEEKAAELNRFCANNNVGISVYDTGGFVPLLVFSNNSSTGSFMDRLQHYIMGEGFRADEIIEKGEDYFLYRIYDPGIGSNQIECVGQARHSFYVISTSVQGIKDSVKVTNAFLLPVGLGAVLLCGIISYLVSRRLADPVEKLAALSNQIASLDFSGRYEGREKNEIGQLGANMNDMSCRLQAAITDLQEANDQLERDIREKERIDRARKEFLANVSHELKTPIALIQGYSEGLKEGIGEDDPETKDYYVDVIVDEARKMNTIVQRLLNLDEIESGVIEPVFEEFDLVPVITGMLQNTLMLGKDRQVEVLRELPEELMICADEFMLEQVLQNYLSNAFHHVSDPGRITVKAEKTPDDRVYVSVHNTGKNIPEEDISRIWEKFYKVDKARTRAYGGSGIGLSIVKAIMEDHGGSCGVINRPDGVEFWFSLSRSQNPDRVGSETSP